MAAASTQSTVLDIRRGSHFPWQIKLITEAGVEYVNNFRPFFYTIVKKTQVRAVEELIHELAKTLLVSERKRLEKKYSGLALDSVWSDMLDEPCIVEETDYRALIYDSRMGRYVYDPEYRVLKVVLWVPSHVRVLASMLRERGIRCSAFNIVYTCRFSLSNPHLTVCEAVPLYYIIDMDMLDKLKIRYMVYDVEVLRDGTRIVSLYEKRLLEEVDYERLMKECETFIIKKQEDVEELKKRLDKSCQVWVGFNNGRTPTTGFDNPELLRLGIPESLLDKKALIDLSITIQLQAQASGIGTASFSLADIMLSLRDKMKVPPELIEMKLRAHEMLLREDTAVRYNRGDIAISTGLAELFLPYVFGIASFTGLTPDAVAHTLRPGMIFEYVLVRWLEVHGEVAEAREVARTREERELLSGTKVFTFLDIAEIFSAYREYLERVKTSDINEIVRAARKVADKVVKSKIKRGKSESAGGDIQRLFTGKIVHVDVDRMYPTMILRDGVDPCCFVKRRSLEEELWFAEDAVFDVARNPAPFYSLVLYLYKVRSWAKDNAKKYKRLAEEAASRGDVQQAEKCRKLAELFKLLSDLIKPIINSAYGAMAKGSGCVHLGLLVVALKIFLATIRDLLTMMIAAKLLGYEPLYGDTDSLFVKVPEHEDDVKVVEKLQEVAKRLGYTLSHEGTYSFMYIYAKKSYVVGIPRQFIKVKGQLLGKMKHYMSTLVRAALIEALEKGSVEPIIRTVTSIETPLLLIPSLAKRLPDLFLLDVNTQKRQRALGRDLSWRLNVFLKSQNEFVQGLLKCPRPDLVTRARFAALALRYGEKIDSTIWQVDLTKIPISEILDLRALPIPDTSEKLSGSNILVLVQDGERWRAYLVEVNLATSSYLLDVYQGVRKIKTVAVPVSYTKAHSSKLKQMGKLRLSGIELELNVLKEVTDISEIRWRVLDVVKKYLYWSGLYKLLKDVDKLDETIYALARNEKSTLLAYF